MSGACLRRPGIFSGRGFILRQLHAGISKFSTRAEYAVKL